jgi:hypothetical protein
MHIQSAGGIRALPISGALLTEVTMDRKALLVIKIVTAVIRLLRAILKD